MPPRHLRATLLAALVLIAPACDEQVVDVATDPVDAATAADDSGEPMMSVQPPTVLCAEGNCLCNNGRDDDGDGLLDGADPECTGPYDDDEASFSTGIVGGEPVGCQDCFFDANATSADDDCNHDARCEVPGALERQDEDDWVDACGLAETECKPSAQCVSSCKDLTPNGCDCFGCCEMRKDDEKFTVRLVDTCSLDRLDDEEACPPCKRNKECENKCGMCELCPGRGVDDLPASCEDEVEPGGPGYACDEWEVCGEALPCRDDFYCNMGCCLPILF